MAFPATSKQGVSTEYLIALGATLVFTCMNRCEALFENCENTDNCTDIGAYCRMADSICVCNKTTHYQTSGQSPKCATLFEEEKSSVKDIVIVLIIVPLVVAVGIAVIIIVVVRRWKKNANHDQTVQHDDDIKQTYETGQPKQQRRHFSTFTEEEVMGWLKIVNIERYETIFRGYNGRDISRLSKDDFILLCGPTDGLRLYNRLHKRRNTKEDQTPRNREDFKEEGLYAELDETTREKSNYDDIQIGMGTITK